MKRNIITGCAIRSVVSDTDGAGKDGRVVQTDAERGVADVAVQPVEERSVAESNDGRSERHHG